MRLLLALALAGLWSSAIAANFDPAKQTNIFVGGGSDPTKLPLAGGTETGPVYSTSFIQVGTTTETNTWISSNGVQTTGFISSSHVAVGYSSTTLPSPPMAVHGGDADGVGFRLMAELGTTAPTGAWAMVGSTSAFAANRPIGVLIAKGTSYPSDVLALLFYDPSTGLLSLNPAGGSGGSLNMSDTGDVALTAETSHDATVSGGTSATYQAVNVNAPVTVQQGPGAFGVLSLGQVSAGITDIRTTTVKFSGGVTSGKAMCKNASNVITTCTSVVAVDGSCTCP